MSPGLDLDHNLIPYRASVSDNLNQCSHLGLDQAYPDSWLRHMNQVWAGRYLQCKAASDHLVHSLVLCSYLVHNLVLRNHPVYVSRNSDQCSYLVYNVVQYRRLVHSAASSLVFLDDNRVPRTSLPRSHCLQDDNCLIYRNIHYFHKSILSDSHVIVRSIHLELCNRSARHSRAHFP